MERLEAFYCIWRSIAASEEAARRGGSMSSYRHLEKPPVPFHALDSGRASSMHLEVIALYGLLLDAAHSLGIAIEDTEKAIDYRIQEAAKREEEAWATERHDQH